MQIVLLYRYVAIMLLKYILINLFCINLFIFLKNSFVGSVWNVGFVFF